MWRSIILHEFSDRNIRNFKALPGHLDSSTAGLFFTGGQPQQALQIIPGSGFSYLLDNVHAKTIGFSIRVRIRYPNQINTGSVEILRLEPAVVVQFEPLDNSPALMTLARGILRIGTIRPFSNSHCGTSI